MVHGKTQYFTKDKTKLKLKLNNNQYPIIHTRTRVNFELVSRKQKTQKYTTSFQFTLIYASENQNKIFK